MSHVMTLERARALALASQGLTGAPFPAGRPGVHAALDRLGYVQIDTIAIVERAHHHVIWSRVPDYRPPLLDALYGAGIFEYWSHAAALLPIQDFRHCLPRMRAFAEGHRHWFRRNRRTMRHVLDRIRAEGPLSASDFEAPPGHRGGSWFEWKPAKQAMEHLFHEGALMVARRRAFQADEVDAWRKERRSRLGGHAIGASPSPACRTSRAPAARLTPREHIEHPDAIPVGHRAWKGLPPEGSPSVLEPTRPRAPARWWMG